VQSDGGHVFKGESRRVEAVTSSGRYESLVIVLTGACHVKWSDAGQARRLDVSRGEVMYRPSSVRLTESNDPQPRTQSIVLYFRSAQPLSRFPRKVADRHGLIRTLGDAMLSIQDSSSANRPRIENGYLAAALAEFQRLDEREDEDLPGRLTRYVYDNLRSRITLAALAAHLGAGPRQLQRQFKAVTSHSPMQTVRRIRIEAAARLIAKRSARTLKEAALRVGICNEQELSRLIKRHTGLTAGELRGGSVPPRRR